MEVTNTELFKSLSQLQIGNNFIDLHNDYYCTKINFNSDHRSLVISFISSKDSKIDVLFDDVEILDFIINLSLESKNSVIDNIYRGRFLFENELLETKDGKGFIYIDFLDEKSLIIKCQSWRVTVGKECS